MKFMPEAIPKNNCRICGEAREDHHPQFVPSDELFRETSEPGIVWVRFCDKTENTGDIERIYRPP